MRHTTRLLALVLSLSSTASAVTLPTINCAKDAGNVRCSLKDANQGKVGSGPALNSRRPRQDRLRVRGTLPATACSFPVELGGQQDNQGVVMRVDLSTGNRSIVSGYDGERWHGAA